MCHVAPGRPALQVAKLTNTCGHALKARLNQGRSWRKHHVTLLHRLRHSLYAPLVQPILCEQSHCQHLCDRAFQLACRHTQTLFVPFPLCHHTMPRRCKHRRIRREWVAGFRAKRISIGTADLHVYAMSINHYCDINQEHGCAGCPAGGPCACDDPQRCCTTPTQAQAQEREYQTNKPTSAQARHHACK